MLMTGSAYLCCLHNYNGGAVAEGICQSVSSILVIGTTKPFGDRHFVV
jgi:hypothetical protein